jgi:hypothetical protein
VDSHRLLLASGGRVVLRPDGLLGLAGEEVGQLGDVVAGDQRVAAFALVAQPIDELGTQDVDLAVQIPAFVGDLVLLGGELVDQVLQLFVAERTEIGKGVLHLAP